MLQIADKGSATPAVESRSAEEREGTGSGTALEEVVLQNSNQFYRWHTELEAARTLETEEKYRRYADTLSGHLASCDALLEKVSQSSISALEDTGCVLQLRTSLLSHTLEGHFYVSVSILLRCSCMNSS